MGFDVMLFYMRGKWRAALVVVNEVLVTLFGCAMVIYGTQLAAKVWSDRLPMIGISKGWDYVPIVAGGVLVIIFSLKKLLLLQASGERLRPMPLFSGGHGSEA